MIESLVAFCYTVNMTYDTNTPIAKQLRLPQAALSTRLTQAIGILKGRGAQARKEIREMRRDWDMREKRQLSLARRKNV